MSLAQSTKKGHIIVPRAVKGLIKQDNKTPICRLINHNMEKYQMQGTSQNIPIQLDNGIIYQLEGIQHNVIIRVDNGKKSIRKQTKKNTIRIDNRAPRIDNIRLQNKVNR